MALKKQERQAMILEILAHNVIDSQEEILHRLQHAGIAVTQATISRDIKELRIVRRPDATGQSRYQVMADATNTTVSDKNQIEQGFADMAVEITPVSFMVVVKTTQGNGNRLAAMIDAAEMPDVIGTLAGHNTIYVTTPTADAAVALVEQFNNWMQ
ncbi:arginine repressor [Weissella paramesenteroides]|uniref:arginine repressor n=1 Tax=Weissella paramesenteroides TaxID=1249 RepID=UPI003D35B72D